MNKLLIYIIMSIPKNSVNSMFFFPLHTYTDFSDSDRLERFFDSEDEEFEILSL